MKISISTWDLVDVIIPLAMAAPLVVVVAVDLLRRRYDKSAPKPNRTYIWWIILLVAMGLLQLFLGVKWTPK